MTNNSDKAEALKELTTEEEKKPDLTKNNKAKKGKKNNPDPVSYTHLTLPTIYSV